jgi:hypothetical protein
MKGMFEDKSVKYCHYDEDNDTFISHTKLNIPLIRKILLDIKLIKGGLSLKTLQSFGYNVKEEKEKKGKGKEDDKEMQRCFNADLEKLIRVFEAKPSVKPPVELYKIPPGPEGKQQRKLLAAILNANFSEPIKKIANKTYNKIANGALTGTGSDGISDFVVVGEELERAYFRSEEGADCTEAIGAFLKEYVLKKEEKTDIDDKIKKLADDLKNKNKAEREKELETFMEGRLKLQKLQALQKVALVLSKGKGKLKDGAGNVIEVKNFHDLDSRLNEIAFPITTEVKGVTYEITKDTEGKISIEMEKLGEKKTIIGKPFIMKEAGELFATAINSNPNSRAYSLYNQGALLNFSGGLYGYTDKNDHPEKALDLGCSHIVGHRPTIQSEKGNFISLNVPVVTGKGLSKTLQTDYNGKNEEQYINCRITKFGKDGHPHLLGVSRMLESKIKEKGEGETTQKKSSDLDVDGEMKKEAGLLFKNLFVGEGGILNEEQKNEFVNFILTGSYLAPQKTEEQVKAIEAQSKKKEGSQRKEEEEKRKQKKRWKKK